MIRNFGTALAIASLFCLTNFATAATDSANIAISATVPAVLSITAIAPAVVPIPAAADIGVGSIAIQSNNTNGFSLAFRSTSAGSSLVEITAPAITDTIDYEVWFNLQGTLPGAEPSGPFTWETSEPATGFYADNNYNFPGGGTSVVYGVNLKIPTFGAADPGTYVETLEFELNDL